MLQTAHDASPTAVLMDDVPGLDPAAAMLTGDCAWPDEFCVMTPILISSTITASHVVHSPSIRSRSTQLGDSTGGNMLRNPLCFVIQQFMRDIGKLLHQRDTARLVERLLHVPRHFVSFPPAQRRHQLNARSP
ncbi:hypothetical protein HPB50_010193 [Hyalomma asiaticum]|uniref:Uncharacterized protein n=1 Tax=Hyalomma asiaticum TaxID=266040 RepID=A0ACB7SE00_HYAAI|nr:hypothetical protein HPB50_010193 [Hyalomma asiaticum]